MNKFKAVGILFVAVFYIIFPLDLIPDFFPIIGQLDDLGVLVWGISSAYTAWNKPPKSKIAKLSTPKAT